MSRLMCHFSVLAMVTALFLFEPRPAAAAQRAFPPFFGGGQAALFDPEIGVVNSGVVNDVQAVVSHDRKYVTLNMRSDNSKLLAIRNVTFQQGPALGFVGGAAANANVNAVAAANSVLDRAGTFRVDQP